MDINERIVKIINHEGLSIAAFARTINIADQTVRSVCVMRRNKPSFDFLSNIVQTFAWVNPRWLLTGNGEMERDDCGLSPVEAGDKNMKELINYLKEKDRRIEELVEERTRWRVLYENGIFKQ